MYWVLRIFPYTKETDKAIRPDKSEGTVTSYSFSVTIANVNIFLLMKKEGMCVLILLSICFVNQRRLKRKLVVSLAGLMLRVDSLVADKQPDKTVLSMEGIKGLFIVPGAPFSCTKSLDIQVLITITLFLL